MFFQALLRIDLTIEAKEALWLNVSEHLDGNHKKCLPHKECERWAKINEGNNREVLDRFLDKTKELLTKCDRIHSTQMCESLHSVKSHYANKSTAWKSSWAPRICAAILNINEKNWAMNLYRRLSLPPLSEPVVKKLEKIEEDKWKSRLERHKESYKELERKRRRLKREKHNKDNEHSLYKGIQTRAKYTRTKRKYTLKKMPKKIGQLNQWFKLYGFNGTASDDDYDEWIEEEDYEEDYYEEDFDDNFHFDEKDEEEDENNDGEINEEEEEAY